MAVVDDAGYFNQLAVAAAIAEPLLPPDQQFYAYKPLLALRAKFPALYKPECDLGNFPEKCDWTEGRIWHHRKILLFAALRAAKKYYELIVVNRRSGGQYFSPSLQEMIYRELAHKEASVDVRAALENYARSRVLFTPIGYHALVHGQGAYRFRSVKRKR